MSKCIIGLGKCSYFYFYILGSFICNNLKHHFSRHNILVMNDHKLVKNIYKFTSYILLGILSNFILNRNLKSKKRNENSDNERTSSQLIFYDALYLEFSNKNIFLFILICFTHMIYQESVELFHFFRLNSLLLWTAHLAFMLIFMNYYFPQNIYKHQKYSMISVIIIDSILIIISTLLKIKDNKNIYQLRGIPLCILILFIYIIFAFMNAFSCVQIKQFIDKKYISPYNVIIVIGIIGFILSFLTSLFFSIFGNSCTEEYKKNIICYCDALSYFDDIKSSFKDNKKLFFIRAFLITPIYLIIEFVYIALDITIIKYLNPIYSLLTENIYFLIFIIYSFINQSDKKLRFFISLSSEIFEIIGFCIYLELIELRFCGLNENTRINIILRGESDSDQAKNNESNSNFSVEDNYNIINEDLSFYD